jgi:hypothetical protein
MAHCLVDLLGGFAGALGQTTHLAGNHRKTASMFARTRRLDAAFSASRLVWPAISLITLMILPMASLERPSSSIRDEVSWLDTSSSPMV